MNSTATSEGCDTSYLNMSSINGQCAIEKKQLNGQNSSVHSDQIVIKESPPSRKEDYTSDMGIFNRKNGPPFDGTPINLLDDKSFVINDKMRSSFRDIMNKMSENTPTLGNLLAKTKYTGLNTKDTKSTINLHAPPPSIATTAPSVSSGTKSTSVGNLFDKMQEMQNSSSSVEEMNECKAKAKVESETKDKCLEVIELDDSTEENETKDKVNCDLSMQSNDLKAKSDQMKSEEEMLEIGSEEEEEERKKLNENDILENDMRSEEENKLLASDEDTQQSGLSIESHQSQESTSKGEESQDSVDCDKKSASDHGKDSECVSDKMDVDEEEEESGSENDVQEKKEKNEISEDSVHSEDSKSSEDSKRSDSKDVKEEKEKNDKKRPATFQEGYLFEPKRSRLDMVIGKLGSQIGIAPESLKDDEMSDTDTATESTPTPTEDTEDEDEERSVQRKKKKPPVRLSEKALDKMVKTKVLNYLKTEKEGLVAELRQKVEELQASNDMWKQRAKDLEKQILDVTVLQQKHEKRKAKTAALRQITTKNVGVQVDSHRTATLVQVQQQVQQTTPVKSPVSKPVNKTPTTTFIQTHATSKPGPILTISKTTSSSPQLAPPRSTLNPVTNIPILKNQTSTQPQEEIPSENRFAKPVMEKEINDLVKNRKNKNTRRSTDWVSRTWQEWVKSRGNVPDLLQMSIMELNHYLSCFVIECRRKDKSEYPPNTLYQMCCGLLRYMRDHEVIDKNFMDLNDHRFAGFHKTLDARMKDLTSRGLGVQKQQSDPITADDEENLWTCNQLGVATSQSLFNTVFYYNCKIFGLKGLDEHRKLECNQFRLSKDSGGSYIEFQGRSRKNYQGGIKQRKIEAKSLKHYTDPGKDRSLFDIYDLYLSLIGNEGPFYKRPLDGTVLRFSEQPLGLNKLSTIIKDMTEKAGMQGRYTNHSAIRSCATTLFQSGVDQQSIMARTGHQSNTVRAYKRPCESQECLVSKLLDSPSDEIAMLEPSVKKPTIPKPIHDGECAAKGVLTNSSHIPINISNGIVNFYTVGK
ncbi:uncharacterized protein LOC125671541 isoform X2 [Ostrea edulis]|uniref:uncharacterized protein LOC125671541 isoform X2 n=1 Tax=Ostrea edulis TaxID=37623 RepID=UPI0024AFF303|nr:uncharacterized protein LOC125671541 isoform X2 [Ostrea edulis]XP_056018868.1 uncharacterized protein LOC125671541 isoform X2 [Ostrea edulis]